MLIDLTEAMLEPTEEEIEDGIRKFISFNIRRDKATRAIVDQLQAGEKKEIKYAAIKVSLSLAKEMSGMFIQGKFFGLPLLQDTEATGYSATLVTQEEVARDAEQALKIRPAVRPSAGADAGETT